MNEVKTPIEQNFSTKKAHFNTFAYSECKTVVHLVLKASNDQFTNHFHCDVKLFARCYVFSVKVCF